jgi:hypothetical protein
MPKRYARDFQRGACERLVAGEKVSSLSKGWGVFEADPLSLEASSSHRRRQGRGHQELRS